MILYAGGYLSFYLPQSMHSLEIRLDAPTSLKDVLGRLSIPVEEVQLVSLNGELAEVETVIVRDTDVVRIFPGVNGG
jgi:sulfur carrier protein ThiS